jgi:hypothetical protein
MKEETEISMSDYVSFRIREEHGGVCLRLAKTFFANHTFGGHAGVEFLVSIEDFKRLREIINS